MDNNQVESTINLQDLFSLLWKNVILIAAITILLTAIVGLYTKYMIPKMYSSETTLRVAINPDSINYTDLQASQKLVATYAIYATSQLVLTPVIEDKDLNLDMTYNQLKNSISVTSVNSTDVIAIKVTLTDSNLAAAVANKVSEEFQKVILAQMKIDTLTTIDPAVVNKTAVSPNLKLNVVIGFVLGLMISVGFVLMKSFLDRTIKNEEDVEKYLNVPVLGLVPVLDKTYIK